MCSLVSWSVRLLTLRFEGFERTVVVYKCSACSLTGLWSLCEFSFPLAFASLQLSVCF